VATAVEWTAIGTLAVVAAFGDVRTGRVPNTLTFGAAAIGLLFSAAHGGSGGLGASLLGYVVGLGVFLPLFALGGMGGGDVKLLAAFGAWLGPIGVLGAAVCASLVGGAFAIIVAARRGYLLEALRNVGALAAVWRTVGPARVPEMTLSEGRGPRLAYAVPIGIGAILALWLGPA
jgi:prepilin peptidase CpaA